LVARPATTDIHFARRRRWPGVIDLSPLREVIVAGLANSHDKIREGAHARAVIIRTMGDVEGGNRLGVISGYKHDVGDFML